MYLATSVTTFSMLSVYLPQELGAQFVSRSSILRLENSCSIFPSKNTRKNVPFGFLSSFSHAVGKFSTLPLYQMPPPLCKEFHFHLHMRHGPSLISYS